MAVASPVDVAVNPNNSDQRYILWNNGRIDAIGGAVPISSSTTWYDRFEPPGVALHISNWTTGEGYVLDYRGGFNPLNGAPNVGSGDNLTAMPGIAISSSPRVRLYVDWSWDPAGTGQGYVLDKFGELHEFGGATATAISGPRFVTSRGRKLRMQWTPSKKAYVMDMNGALWGDYFTALTNRKLTSLQPPRDVARDFEVTNWTDGSGHILDRTGRTHAFGSATAAYGYPVRAGGDVARTLHVLSAVDPARFWQVWFGGQQYEYLSSTPPTVTAGGDASDPSPATSVTDTTRPDLRWDYSDPQGDSQAAYQVLVFTQAWVDAHSMTDPLAWKADALVYAEGIDPNARGVDCPVDLSNGTYRMYVRAQDTAAQWSAWSNRGWTQNITPPPTPTGLTATANQAAFTVALSVSTSVGTADLVRFEFSDDGGTSWATVRGLGAVPRSATTTGTDYDAPLGVTRTYRAVAYAVDPRVASVPSNTATATLTTKTYLLTAVDDSTLGGRVKVQLPVGWSRPVSAGVFQGLGAEWATVVKDGNPPKSKRATLRIHLADTADTLLVTALAESGSTLVYRSPQGEVRYCEVAGGEWGTDLHPSAATQDVYETTLPLVEVRPPVEG